MLLSITNSEYVEKSTIIITSITGKVVKEFDMSDIKGQFYGILGTIENGLLYALKQGTTTGIREGIYNEIKYLTKGRGDSCLAL
jgi:hypothetical protein